MATVEYDLDTSGGLMPQIQALIAPPVSDDASKAKKKEGKDLHPYYKRPGKGHNHDCCDACGEGGDLLCCDKCPASFHFQCHDPPLDEADLPIGEWLCHACRMEATKAREAEQNTTKGDARGRLRGVRRETADPTSPPPEKKVKRDAAAVGMEMLVQAAAMLNPRQFDLPKELTMSLPFPGTDKPIGLPRGPTRGRGAVVAKKKPYELDNGLVPLPVRTCFECRRSCRKAPLVACDYCPLLFHQDCLDPPLTSLPSGLWMCPNHPEQFLDSTLLTSCSASERVRLWDKYSGPIDQDAIKVEFIRKAHRRNPPFRFKVRLPPRNTVRVPDAVKAHYACPPPLVPSLRTVLREEEAFSTAAAAWRRDISPLLPAAAAASTCTALAPSTSPSLSALASAPSPALSASPSPSSSSAPVAFPSGSSSAAATAPDPWPHAPFRNSPPSSTTPSASTKTSTITNACANACANAAVVKEEDENDLADRCRDVEVALFNGYSGEEANDCEAAGAAAKHLRRKNVPTPTPPLLNGELRWEHGAGDAPLAALKIVDKNGHCLNSGGGCAGGGAAILQPRPGCPVTSVVRPTPSSSSAAPSPPASRRALAALASQLEALLEATAPAGAGGGSCGGPDERLVRLLALQRLQQLLSSAPSPQSSTPPPQQQQQPPPPAPPQTQPPAPAPGPPPRVRARALLVPLAGRGPSCPMSYRTLSVGTGADNDVVLVRYGHCNFVSPKHAAIFFDETSQTYEMLNYSEHGTRVDNVLYSCDFSERPLAAAGGPGGGEGGGGGGGRSTAEELAAAVRAELDRRRGIPSPPSFSQPAPRMAPDSGKDVRRCSCRDGGASAVGGSGGGGAGGVAGGGAGWEGTALIAHGTLLRFGCLSFVFSVTDHAPVCALLPAVSASRAPAPSPALPPTATAASQPAGL